MSKNFVKIRNRNACARWIKSILLGLTFGLLVGGALLALSKFGIIPLLPIWILPIGAGSAALVWVAAWLILRRTDRAIAKKLDKKFELSERVQTMLEYEKVEGAMYALQREDTEASLAAIPKKKLRIKRLWIYAVAFVLSVATLATAVVIKPKDVSANPGPTPVAFKLEEWQRVGLETLIITVEASEMESPYRENVVQSLREMLEELKVAEMERQMEASVSAAIDEILLEMDKASWVIEFTETLWAGNNKHVRELMKAINYYEWGQGKEWSGYSDKMTNFINSFRHADETKKLEEGEVPDGVKMVAETAEALSLASASLSEGLSTFLSVYELDESDPLYAAFAKLNNLGIASFPQEDGLNHVYGLSALATQLESLGENGTLDDYKALFEGEAKLIRLIDALKKEIYDVLTPQYKNTNVGKNAVTEVCRILSYDRPRFDEPNLAEEEESEGGDQPSIIPPGNPETDNAYGGDEWILDYTKNELVKYGELFSKYEPDALDKARDESNSYTEEQRKAIERYFEILKVGFKEEGETNE